MNRKPLALLAVLVGVTLGTAARAADSAPAVRSPVLNVSVETLPKLDAAFHASKHWLGADAAYSFMTHTGENVWWFGDTFISMKGDGKPETMPNNTIAFLHGGTLNPDFDFRWGTEDKRPGAFLQSPHKHEWYWPGDGAAVGDKLFMFMKRVKTRSATGKGAFNFDWFADDLVCFAKDDSADRRWKLAMCKGTPESNRDILFGTACVQDVDYLYAYCSSTKDARQFQPHPCVIARIEKSRLAHADPEDWQYWNEQKQIWSPSRNDASVLFYDAAPEMTVSSLPINSLYIAVYMPPLSDKIMVRTALRPQGPFSSPIEVYKCPEAGIGVNGKQVMVYSAKAHPELSLGDELVITYCSNPGNLSDFLARPDLYTPHAIKVHMQMWGTHTHSPDPETRIHL